MAWYDLDEWSALGASGEGVKVALQKIAAQLEGVAESSAKLSADAAARAEYARAMWKNLDELSVGAVKALDSVDRSRLDAQMIARIETMRAEFGKMRSFSEIAQETSASAKRMSAIGGQLGGIISAVQLLWVVNNPNASSYEVIDTAVGILGGIVGGAMVTALLPATISAFAAGVATVGGGMFLGALAKGAWQEYIAPNILDLTADNSPLFRDDVSRTIDRLIGGASSGVTVASTRTDGDWTITTYSNGVEIRMSTVPLETYLPGFEPGYIAVGDRWEGYSMQITTPNGKGSSTVQYIGQSGTITKTDTNGDGIFDHIKTEARIGDGASVVGEDINGDGITDRNFVVNNGQRYDLSNARDAIFADSLLSRYRTAGLLSGTSYLDLSQIISKTLTYGGRNDYGFTMPNGWYNPIGAFYEAKSAALDTAASIAEKTPVLLDANRWGLSVNALRLRDANRDGKLSGAELDGLQVWVDANEDGIGDAGEFRTLAQAGIAEIRAVDYDVITRGNHRHASAPAAAPAKHWEAAQPGRMYLAPAVPFSNYRTLRDTEKLYWINGSDFIFFGPNQIKVHNNNRSCLVGTDGNDVFDANYYASYGHWINSSLLVNFLAGGGDDVMGGSNRNDNLWGGTGNDTLFGYAGDDRLYGEEGDDELNGGDGNDVLDGGVGNDRLFGQAGNDIMNGGDGDDIMMGFTASNESKQTLAPGETDDDVMYGGFGNDRMWGGLGNDYMDGGDGADLVCGGHGNDTVFGGAGNDELHGDEGNDRLLGEAGHDRIFGEAGDDVIWGGDGDDVLVGFTASNDAKQWLAYGESDNDTLYGGNGNDSMYGGLGNDYLDGGNDDDFLDGGDGDDRLFGGAGNDVLNGGNGHDVLSGESGNDKIFGGAGNDTIWGGDGDDILVVFTASNEAKQSLAAWETDDDTIYGGAGNDLIMGGLGNDLLYGEAGNDELQGGDGNDRLYGGDGNDRLFGQVGNDILYGGAGDDLLVGFTAHNEAKRTLGPGESDDDYLDGGAGADHMEGGQGNDTYIVNSVNDVILEFANEGYDTVISSANYILNANLEELRLVEGFNINGTGNALDNRIVGNSSDNILDGVTGADTMIGGKGNDTYYVDNVGDRVVELAGEGVDTVQSKISYALGDHVENLNLLDFGKPEKGLVDGAPVLVYGYPKANELDYMQGDAVPTFQGTCALTSIANLLTQIGTPTTEGEVVRRAIDNQWAVTSPAATDYQRGGSNYIQQQALLKSYGIANNLLAGYDEHAIANLVRSGRGVILALNAGRLWADGAYLDNGGVNHVVTVTGAVYGEADGALKGFYIADSGRQSISDMTRYVSIREFRLAANVPNAYAIYTAEALKLWNEDIDGTGNALDNTIIGNRGNNVLDGGAGNDILVGGLGNDTYRFGRGSGRDTIREDDDTLGNSDVIRVGGGVSADQLWFRHVGNDLEISILGTGDRATVQDWYLGSRYQIEQIRTDDGRTLVNSDVEKLVQAMAAWAPPATGAVTLSPERQAALAPTLAANWR